MNSRKIIHIDMDAFFASVEQRDNPDLRGKAIVVGGSNKRGVVSTASYEARKYGIKSAMAGHIAYQKLPSLIFVKPRFEAYKEASIQIMKIFRKYTDLVEPVGFDEAYLDVTDSNISATQIAQKIKNEIQETVELTSSAGISFNKFLAKIASDYNKPNGFKVIKPNEASNFIDSLPIGKIPGIGKVTESKMKEMGIIIGKDILNLGKDFLQKHFGKSGSYFFDLLSLKINNPVEPNRIRKSIGNERTFSKNLITEIEVLDNIKFINNKLSNYLINNQIAGKTITLKIKFSDFQIITRSKSLDYFIMNEIEILDICNKLICFPFFPTKPIRLLGVQISNLNLQELKNKKEQIRLFS